MQLVLPCGSGVTPVGDVVVVVVVVAVVVVVLVLCVLTLPHQQGKEAPACGVVKWLVVKVVESWLFG